MLTIQSNLKITDLETLSKTLIKPDIINFGLSKVGGGYTDEIADKVITKLSKLAKDKTIAIINDITLQMADKLLEAGYKNIHLAFGSFNKDGTVSKDKTVHNIMKAIIKNNIKQKLNVISLEEIFNMKIDGVIANVPYGAIGANIAYTIRDKIDYEYFVNLLPANDYKRNKTKDLFNYQSEMEVIKDGFDDAAVTTHLCLISKTKVNNMTLDEFERSQYIDRSLDKYFEENSKRAMTTLFDTSILSAIKNYDVNTTFIIGWRDPVNKHMPYKKDVTTYLWNVEETINFAYVIEHHLNKANNSVPFGGLIFKTAAEKKNYSKFIYSKNGFRFMAKLFTAVQSDMLKTMSTYFIKVDWTHPWTVEEILKDYGYTEDEIKTVMADLDNFKGMDD